MNQKGFASLFIILILILAVVVVGVSIFIARSSSPNQDITESTRPADTAMTPEETPWKKYTNVKYGFSILYPEQLFGSEGKIEYEEREFKESLYVGFRPSSNKTAYLWTVSVYEDKNMQELIKEDGSQLGDRSQTSEDIVIDGINSQLVTTSGLEADGTESRVQRVYFEVRERVFVITNINSDADEFSEFYSSFKLR